MFVNVRQATGKILDQLVAKCLNLQNSEMTNCSCNWNIAGFILDKEKINVFQLEREALVDQEGFCTGNYKEVWGATKNKQHCIVESRNYYGESLDEVYEINKSDVVCGDSMLMAIMRCYVVNTLGELPKL